MADSKSGKILMSNDVIAVGKHDLVGMKLHEQDLMGKHQVLYHIAKRVSLFVSIVMVHLLPQSD